jgi:hypothetical protein
MTMRCVDVVLTDLEREFRLARYKPGHLTPQPRASSARSRTGLDGLIDVLLAAQHVIGDVPPLAPAPRRTQAPSQALRPPHQDPRPG